MNRSAVNAVFLSFGGIALLISTSDGGGSVALRAHGPAGPDQVVYTDSAAGSPVTLDGAAFPDGAAKPLGYTWTRQISAPHGPIPVLVAFGRNPTVVFRPGTYQVTMTVSDGTVVRSDVVEIRVVLDTGQRRDVSARTRPRAR